MSDATQEKAPCSMTHRQRAMAILHYEDYDRLPIVHFGYWRETLAKWASEGHITQEQAETWTDGNTTDAAIEKKLGFDFNWSSTFQASIALDPGFGQKVVKEFPDGTQHIQNNDGVIVLARPEAGSIPAEIAHTLVDRASWEKHYKWRYEFKPERVTKTIVRANDKMLDFEDGGLAFLQADQRDYPYALYCGSLYGHIRNVVGVEGGSYLMVDDEPLFDEIIDTVGQLCYQVVKALLETGAKFDYGHFWEDICFKNGPLVSPRVFAAKVGPHYKRITSLLKEYGIDIVSLDCDGCIDALVPVWLENGVNTMFPIEVGTWKASVAPWREQYGQDLRGVGGMDKKVFAYDRAAIDAEIERLRPLVDLGGFIPCPDHRIASDGKWDLVRYYCDRMHEVFD